jgi:hypothetical protein
MADANARPGKELIVARHSLPTRKLADRPDLDQLKRQAKDLLQAFRDAAPEGVAEVTAHYHDADSATFALHDAQLVIARAYGFESWSRLKAYVEGATDQRLVAAVQARDVPQVRALVEARPELSGGAARCTSRFSIARRNWSAC